MQIEIHNNTGEKINSINDLNLLSINKARQILKIRSSTVNKLIDSGQIEIVFINNRKKIPMINLRDFINRSSKYMNDKKKQIKSLETAKVNSKLKKIINRYERR